MTGHREPWFASSGVCHRCERVQKPGGIWITVEQAGVYAQRWEFCTIECLGSHFEVRPDLLADPRDSANSHSETRP